MADPTELSPEDKRDRASRILQEAREAARLREEETQPPETTYSRPSTPVSPAPPPSAGVGGSTFSKEKDPAKLDRASRILQEARAARAARQPQEERGSLDDYTGETFRDIGIELPDKIKKDLGENPKVPMTKVEKEYISKYLPSWVPYSDDSEAYGGREAIDLNRMRNDLIRARQVNWIKDFRKSNERAPSRDESKAAWARLANEANEDIYELARKQRGQRPSAVFGSSGQPNRILWADIDSKGQLHGGIGPIKIGEGEDKGWFSTMLAPLAIMGAGADQVLVADELDEDGKPTGGYVLPTYNENHALGWLDYLGRMSAINAVVVAGAAGGADSPYDFLKPAMPSLAMSKAILPDSWINPLQKGWGTEEHLQRIKRGEDYVSLSGELALGKLMLPMRMGIWAAEESGLIEESTAETHRALTDFAAGMGVALADPDLLSIATAGVGKVAKLKALGKAGDVLGASAKVKAHNLEKISNKAADKLVAVISKPGVTDDELSKGTVEALSELSPAQRHQAIEAAKVMISTDPKLSKITEEVLKNLQRQAGKPIENLTTSGMVKKGEEAARRRGIEGPAKEMGKVSRGEKPVYKRAAERVEELKKDGDVKGAKTLARDMVGYRKAQLSNMARATVLADLVAQKGSIRVLRGLTRASRKTSKSIPALQKEVGEVTALLQDARKRMIEAFETTAKPRGVEKGGVVAGPVTKAYDAAKTEYDSALMRWNSLAMEMSTAVADDTEKLLDGMIAAASKSLKSSDRRLNGWTKRIGDKGYKFKVSPKEHKKLIKAVVKKAPQQMQQKLVTSALAVTLREMGAQYGKLANFAEEVRPGGITGSMFKAIEAYESSVPGAVKLLSTKGLKKTELSISKTLDYNYTGFSSIADRDDLRRTLIGLAPEGSDFPTIKAVANWVADNVSDPAERVLARKLAEVLPEEESSRLFIIDNSFVRKYGNTPLARDLGDIVTGNSTAGVVNFKGALGDGRMAGTKMALNAKDDLLMGLNSETIIHELLHVATNEQLRIAQNLTKTAKKNTPLGKAYRRLYRIGAEIAGDVNPKTGEVLSKARWPEYVQALGKNTEDLRNTFQKYLTEGASLTEKDLRQVETLLQTEIQRLRARRKLYRKGDPARLKDQNYADTLQDLLGQVEEFSEFYDDLSYEIITGDKANLISQTIPSLLKNKIQDLDSQARRVQQVGKIISGRTNQRGTNDLYEVLAYGLTDPAFQKFLKTVDMPKEKATLWTSFVESLAGLLGVSPKFRTALAELAGATESILDIPLAKALEQAGPELRDKYLRGLVGASNFTRMAAKGGESAVESIDDVQEAMRSVDDMYLIKQVTLLSGWSPAADGSITLRSWLWLKDVASNMYDPARKVMGQISPELNQIGVSMFGNIKGMQRDLVIPVDRLAKKQGKEAVKAADEAGDFAGKTGEELKRAQDGVRKKAEAKVFSDYIDSPESVNGSRMNTLWGDRSMWTMAKPMLRATMKTAESAQHVMPFKALAKMWLPSSVRRNEEELGALYTATENLLLYGDVKGKGKLSEAEALKKGASLEWTNDAGTGFSDQLKFFTMSKYTRGGAGGIESNPKKAMAFAAQAVSQMAFLNHSSTRVTKLLAGFPEEAMVSASRLVSGHSLDPGTDLADAFSALNKLKVPSEVKRLAGEANTYIKAGVTIYSDPAGEFKAIVPRSWMDETSKRLSQVEKAADAAYLEAKDPLSKKAIEVYRGAYRIFHTAILTGLILPRPAYWTNIYVGNLSQLIGEGEFRAATRLAVSPLRDVVWASQRLADQTPLGKYVDASLDYVANKLDTDHPLASLTNALVNKNINQVMDPRLADNSVKIVGTDYTMGDIRKMCAEQGVFTSFASSTKLANLVRRADVGKVKSVWDKAEYATMGAFADFADVLEQRQRVGLFTDLVINRGMDPEKAGKIVRDALFDWDYPMTGLETALASRMFMFYNFQRRALGQGMRILMDPLVRGKDDSLRDIVLQSSPILAAAAGKKGYKTSYLMAMEEMVKQTQQAFITPGEVKRDGSVKGGTDPAYPWWSPKANNKIFLPNSPMGEDRGANYTNSVGKKAGDPDISHKVLTVPSFTPIEMVNTWADLAGVMVGYGLSLAELPINVIGGRGAKRGGTSFKDVSNTFAKHAINMGGPISEHAMEGAFRAWGITEDRESYQVEGKAVTRLSDKRILQALDNIPGLSEMLGSDSGMIWKDTEREGDSWRTTPGILGLYKAIPGIPNAINTYWGPLLDNSAEGGAVTEGLQEMFLSAFGFKTYRYSPDKVRQYDMDKINKGVARLRREEERRSGVKKKR